MTVPRKSKKAQAMPSDGVAQRPTVRQSPPTLKEVVAGRLRHAIFSGGLKPNQRIDQDLMAMEFGVSKLPVREALISLENEGLVISVPRRGCFVAPLTREDVYDHYVLIGLVEGRAASRAATRMTDEDLALLRDLLDQFNRATDPEEQGRLNFLFHRHINRTGASRRLRSVLRQLTSTMPAKFYEFARDWENKARREHETIFAALSSRSADASEKAMVAHIESGAELAISILEKGGFWSEDVKDNS
ncbi:MAG: FCD domain-containing protein [Streptosporangiales bacterium]|nr:FCD domain-containing protein [Streptosporangiales bacterium]